MSINEAMRQERIRELANRSRDEADDIREQLTSTVNEVASVLHLMDGLAEQWGDEAVFRRCRDRLRKLVT